jgi:hypothetical protein
MDEKPPAPGQDQLSIVSVMAQTGAQVMTSYERLKRVGFMSASGALVIIATFVLSALPVNRLDFPSQILFVVTGFLMLLISAGVFALQNLHSYQLEIMTRSTALRSLELSHQKSLEALKSPPALPSSAYTPPSG